MDLGELHASISMLWALQGFKQQSHTAVASMSTRVSLSKASRVSQNVSFESGIIDLALPCTIVD